MEQPTAEQALRTLEPFVGEWTVEAKGPDGQVWPGKGRATFEWLPSKAHLVQRTVTGVPGAPDSTSVIGCDVANGTFVQLYSDERGVCRIYSMNSAAVNGSSSVMEIPFPNASLAPSATTLAQSPVGGESRRRRGLCYRLLLDLPQDRLTTRVWRPEGARLQKDGPSGITRARMSLPLPRRIGSPDL